MECIVKSKILRPGFLALIVTQFFGAANDNILKGILTFMVVDGLWRGQLGAGGQSFVGVCFTVPFILLSGYAGQLADRYSKRTLSIIIKFAEIPIAILAGIGFWIGNLWVTLIALIFLTCQSAFFGPAKYGMIPELVDDGDLSRANGTINMMTNIAVIVGTLAAGAVSDAYWPQVNGQQPSLQTSGGLLWAPLVAMLAVSIAGVVSVVFLSKLPSGNPNLTFTWNPFQTYIDSIREMSKTRLLMVMMAWGYFYLLAGIALFLLPEYTHILGVGRFEASVLMAVMGIAIGVGCGVAGLISGHHIEPRLIPIGAMGLTLFFVLLGVIPPAMPDLKPMLRVGLSNVSFFVLGAGFFAGFYIIPLQALLQKLSPDGERGRFLGTANAISFAFMTLAAVVYFGLAKVFVAEPQRIFLVCGGLMFVGTAFFLYQLRGSGIMTTGSDTGPLENLGSDRDVD
jgi:acyl-[acyl-carrier-protein]-phospholipid O-acyltransferase/long-chain-fatty-acid--[acyl-carrier-protein] ligase